MSLQENRLNANDHRLNANDQRPSHNELKLSLNDKKIKPYTGRVKTAAAQNNSTLAQNNMGQNCGSIAMKRASFEIYSQNASQKENISHQLNLSSNDQSAKPKIIISQQQLKIFTNKFAQQKAQYQLIIQKLEQANYRLKEQKNQFQLQAKDLKECLDYTKECLKCKEQENDELKDSLARMLHEHRYNKIVKQEYLCRIKELESSFQQQKRKDQADALEFQSSRDSWVEVAYRCE